MIKESVVCLYEEHRSQTACQGLKTKAGALKDECVQNAREDQCRYSSLETWRLSARQLLTQNSLLMVPLGELMMIKVCLEVCERVCESVFVEIFRRTNQFIHR